VLAIGWINGGTAPSVSGREVSRLEAKSGNDPVHLRSEIPQGLSRRPVGGDFTRAQASEILGRQRGLVLVELDHHTSGGLLVSDGKFEVTPRASSGRWWELGRRGLRCCVFGFYLAEQLVFFSLVFFQSRVDCAYLGSVVRFVKFDQPCPVVFVSTFLAHWLRGRSRSKAKGAKR